jgi:hypothetical protein
MGYTNKNYFDIFNFMDEKKQTVLMWKKNIKMEQTWFEI